MLEASVFDEAIGLFEHMQKDLLLTMCDRVMLDIKAKSRPYRKEKWGTFQITLFTLCADCLWGKNYFFFLVYSDSWVAIYVIL